MNVETWVHHFDPESEKQSMQCKYPDSSLLRNLKKFFSREGDGLCWYKLGVIMVDYLEDGRTINGAYYAEELRRLRQVIVRKRRGKLIRGVLLLQDKAPAHRSQVAMLLRLNPASKSFIIPHILQF